MNSIDFKKEISNFIFTSKYARYNEKENRRETWEETCNRVMNMHLEKFDYLSIEHKKEIIKAFDMVKEKLVVPSMRSMQFAGKAIKAHSPRMYNCSVIHVDSLRSFSECFYLLLCGCGIGLGLSKFFLSRLPDLVSPTSKTGSVITYSIEDSIEGWADSLEALLNCFFKNTPYTGRKIIFDYSKIRPIGTPLKTGGGKAPGYKGLKNAHDKIKELLNYIIEKKYVTRLRPIHAYDILMFASDAVLSGGIRRSATSVIFDKDDNEMLNAKTFFIIESEKRFVFDKETDRYHGIVKVDNNNYNVELKEYEYKQLQEKKIISWLHIAPQRARSNNSVLLLREDTDKKEFCSIVEKTKQFGEPGFVFASHKWQLFNPCFTGDTKIDTLYGQIPIKDLVGKETLVYCYDGKKINISNMYNIRKTESNQEVWKLTLDNNEIIKATPNHKFMLRDGTYKQLRDLKSGDSLMPFRRSKRNSKGYNNLSLNNGTHIGEAQFVTEWKYKRKMKKGECVHHIDGNKQNNSPENLEFKLFSKHSSEHISGDKNPMRRFPERQHLKRNPEKYLKDGNPRWNHNITIEQVVKLWEQGASKKQIAIALNTTYMVVKKRLELAQVDNHKVKKIEFHGYEDIYDGTVKYHHNFALASGVIAHNCFEISFIPVTEDGQCGVQFCNLSSINGAKINTKDDFIKACKSAALIGTLQATYTNFNYLRPTSKYLTEQESLLGVSITGIMDNPKILLNEDYLQEGAHKTIVTNRKWSKILGINEASRVTCLKPEGCLELHTKIKTNMGNLSLLDIFKLNNIDENELNNIQSSTFIKPIKEIYVFDENNNQQQITNLYVNGWAEVYELEDEQGNTFKLTGNHKVKTEDGWKEVKDLSLEDNILSYEE